MTGSSWRAFYVMQCGGHPDGKTIVFPDTPIHQKYFGAIITDLEACERERDTWRDSFNKVEAGRDRLRARLTKMRWSLGYALIYGFPDKEARELIDAALADASEEGA